jgi:hypothetical protein
MAKWYGAAWEWLLVEVLHPIWDGLGMLFRLSSPSTPWGFFTFHAPDLFSEVHTAMVAELARAGAPMILQHWFHVVYDATCSARQARERFEALDEETPELLERQARAQARVAQLNEERKEVESGESQGWQVSWKREVESVRTKETFWTFLSAGLSFMVFLGILEYLQIDINDLSGRQAFLVAIAGFASICLTLSVKVGINLWVKAQHNGATAQTVVNYRWSASPESLWARLRRGDPVVVMSVLFLLLETLFAGPGMIAALPMGLRQNLFWQLSAYISGGLFALANLNLAWATAYEELRLEEERRLNPDGVSRSEEFTVTVDRTVEVRRMFLGALEEAAIVAKVLADHEQKLKRARVKARVEWNRARTEYRVFYRQFRRWFFRHRRALNPELVAAAVRVLEAGPGRRVSGGETTNGDLAVRK